VPFKDHSALIPASLHKNRWSWRAAMALHAIAEGDEKRNGLRRIVLKPSHRGLARVESVATLL
jgi:hypothetical protein